MKKLLLFTFLGILFFAPFNKVLAETNCTPVYGGGENCVTTGDISISKSVRNPETGGFVANLGINDPKYKSDQTISFEVTVTNNDSDTDSITVTDYFPSNFKFVSGPGNFDSSANTLTWLVTGLGDGQSQTFVISGTINGSLPTGNTCLINQVKASSNNGHNGSASSQYCLTNPIQPAPKVTQTPPTGPEALPLMALIPGALAGLGLIKLAKKS